MKFLLIGDGTHKPQLDAAVERHSLDDRVRRVGRVPQAEGARLLKACDIYVSPHNSHMVDSKFFGSPTKVFEYMAMGGGIVASDLEQIGEVLSPALRAGRLGAAGRDRHRTSGRCSARRATSTSSSPAWSGSRAVRTSRPRSAAMRARRSPTLLVAAARRAAVDVRGSGLRAADSGARRRSRPATPTKDRCRTSGTTTRSARRPPARRSRTRWSGSRKSSATATTSTRRGCREVMEFAEHAGEQVLEVGGGMGTDLAQFARQRRASSPTSICRAGTELAQENFRLRGLTGRFVHHDAESLPFDDGTFDLVYSNGVHSPHAEHQARRSAEMLRVLKPGGRAIVMVYAENSLQYWRNLVWYYGMRSGDLATRSMADIMSRTVERTGNDARPLVKVYTKPRLRALFDDFTDIHDRPAPDLAGARPSPVAPAPAGRRAARGVEPDYQGAKAESLMLGRAGGLLRRLRPRAAAGRARRAAAAPMAGRARGGGRQPERLGGRPLRSRPSLC